MQSGLHRLKNGTAPRDRLVRGARSGIEATLQLSQSTNAKVVLIGSGKDGLPIILGNVDTPAPPPAGSTPPTGNDTTKSTAASPTMPLEKTPAAGLATPAEKIPPVSSGTSSAATP